MIVVSFGVPRSGSTLAFEMAKAVLELNGYPQPRIRDDLVEAGHHVNFVRYWSDTRLSRLLETTEGTCLVVKTHGDPLSLSHENVWEALDRGNLRIHVVFRDPRDTIVSMLEHGVHQRRKNPANSAFREVRGVDDAIRELGGRLAALRRWGSFPSLKLQYERFAFDRVGGPQLIAEDLGLCVDPDAVWEMVRDRFTQQNVGRSRRFETDLWPDEVTRIERAFPLFLELVGGNDLGWFGGRG